MKEIINIKKKLKKMNKQQTQKVYQMLHCKNIQSSKQNIIKEILKPLYKKYKMELIEYHKPIKKFEYTGNNCWDFTHKPDVDISKVNKEGIYEISREDIVLHKVRSIDKGSHGNVYLLTDKDNEYKFALKEIEKIYNNGNLIIDNEIPVIKEIEKNKISCDIIPAKILRENDYFWYVIMPKYDNGNLDSFIGKLNSFELINLGIELGGVYQCLLRNNLYYTDSKPSQVLYKCISENTFSVTLGDLGSISHRDEACIQTLPFPPEKHYENFYKDSEKASEKVVVWGFVLMLLMMINEQIELLIVDYLEWNTLRVTKYTNTFEIFQSYISELLLKHPMKDFFETFLGIKKNLYEMIRDGEYTMKHVLEYLTGYPFIIKTSNNLIPHRNLDQLTQLSLECWKKNSIDGYIYCIYVNGEIVSYGTLDKNTLWNLCTNEKNRGKGYAKKIIDQMFRDVCQSGEKAFFLFVDENSPAKWYEKLGFKYIPLSQSEKKKYKNKNIRKMFKECV